MVKKLLYTIFHIGHLLFEILVFFFLTLIIFLTIIVQIKHPHIEDMSALELERIQVGRNRHRIGDNWVRKNDHGVWEIYVAGNPFDRGVVYGKLLEEQIQLQEEHFVGQIEKIVPSSTARFMIKLIIGFMNRDLYNNVPEEYNEEIYGVSFSFSDAYDFQGPKFHRILNYHAAHDIGHALADYMIVGCSAFSVKDEFTQDSLMLVGRNFDFYVGEKFAEEKVIAFIEPDQGYRFASYSWAGLMGTVSGMNETGLCITINASKSELPRKSKTPISIVTRKILQYAATIDEAIELAKENEVFVSETIMVTSAVDNETVLIEINPGGMSTYRSTNGLAICTNHYQSEDYVDESLNQENIAGSDSKYRFNRLTNLIAKSGVLGATEIAQILRDRNGLDNQDIGLGNPKSINQLIAHHSVIFRPSEKQMWISSPPYQLGEFICYDLDEVFGKQSKYDLSGEIYVDSLTIERDPFLTSQEYENYRFYVEIKQKLIDHYKIGIDFVLAENEEKRFLQSNPECYITYMTLGEYYLSLSEQVPAEKYFELALSKEVSSQNEIKKIRGLLDECRK